MSNKVGLALSGGGFRAAFYHVGVLAGLADDGRLRQVEVISAVSGGSIVAALYALHLRKLLERKQDEDVTREDYQAVVWSVGHDLRKGVRRNLRMRIFSNPLASLRMLSPGYTRSNRMAHLYEKYLYQGLGDNSPVRMEDFLIRPPGDPDFHPDEGNPTRRAKVPITLLNSTVLNSGHNWRFEGSRMGEPPRPSVPDAVVNRINKTMRLERAESYADLPKTKRMDYQKFPLKYAVAASTAVPGVFAPLGLLGLYPGIKVQLVDGGVHDNQGLQGLKDRACAVYWISDASGKPGDRNSPSADTMSVLLRSSSIRGARMREEQLIDRLDGKHPGDQVIGTQQFVTPPLVPFKGSNTPTVPRGDAYERSIAAIRTDLDAFNDVESYALSKSGYVAIRQGNHSSHAPGHWPFLNVDQVPKKRREKLLKLGSSKIAKPFLVNPAMKVLGVALLALAGFGVWTAGAAIGWSTIFGPKGLAFVGGLLMYLLLFVLVQRFVPSRGIGTWARVIVRAIPGIPLAFVGMILTNLHLLLLNRVYLSAGRVPGGDWPAEAHPAALSQEPGQKMPTAPS